MALRRLFLGFLFSLSALVALIAATADAAPLPVVHERFVVVIDPGHGGTNEGCASHTGELHEKELTLDVAHRVRDALATALPHAEVLLTREKDTTLTLAERVAFANAADADLFISIHANASPDRNQTGYETYVLDVEASSLEAARTASRENDEGFFSPQATDPVRAMVRELELTANRRKAAEFAQLVQKAQGSRFPDRFDRGVRQAPFDVLMGARMPAALHELGFLDHATEGPRVSDQNGRATVASAMTEAIVEYYRQVERHE